MSHDFDQSDSVRVFQMFGSIFEDESFDDESFSCYVFLSPWASNLLGLKGQKVKVSEIPSDTKKLRLVNIISTEHDQ